MIANLVEAIGEVAIRVKDMDRMVEFYVDQLGFELRRRFSNDVAAIKLAPEVAGQIQTLTLFGESLPGNFSNYRWKGLEHSVSALHHFAVTIASANYDILHSQLRQKNIPFDVANHRWTGWKGTYVSDPEGNILEFVCYDEAFDEGKTGVYDFNKLHGASHGKPFV